MKTREEIIKMINELEVSETELYIDNRPGEASTLQHMRRALEWTVDLRAVI